MHPRGQQTILLSCMVGIATASSSGLRRPGLSHEPNGEHERASLQDRALVQAQQEAGWVWGWVGEEPARPPRRKDLYLGSGLGRGAGPCTPAQPDFEDPRASIIPTLSWAWGLPRLFSSQEGTVLTLTAHVEALPHPAWKGRPCSPQGGLRANDPLQGLWRQQDGGGVELPTPASSAQSPAQPGTGL